MAWINLCCEFLTRHFREGLDQSGAPGGSWLALGLPQYLVGIFIAVAVFIIQEQIKDKITAHRFRAWVVSDITTTTSNYKEHLEALTLQHRQLGDYLEGVRQGGRPELLLYPIWAGTLGLSTLLFENAGHLKTDAFRNALAFYCVGERIDEIRKAYNATVIQSVLKGQFEVQRIQFLNSLIVSLLKNYREFIADGVAAVSSITGNHWFLSIEEHWSERMMDGLKE